MHLKGTKEDKRNRTVIITGSVIDDLLEIMRDKANHERIFTAGSSQISTIWYNMRKRYKLPHFRFKDLRHAFAKHAVLSRMEQTASQNAMGHSDEQITRHFAALVAKMSVKDATRLAESMGLTKRPPPSNYEIKCKPRGHLLEL